MVSALLLLQMIGGRPDASNNSFDIVSLPSQVPKQCSRASTTEIVVCARRLDVAPYRAATPSDAEPLLPRAEFGLVGKARMSFDGEHVKVGGFDTNRAMVTVKVPFGGRP